MTPEEAKAAADAILRRDGFRDIESPSGAIASRPVDGSRAEYYRAAEEQITRYTFRVELHREIWWRHCQGEPARSIARALRLNRKSVQKVIERVRSQMQARMGRRCGRPEDHLGHGMHAKCITVKLSEREYNAAERIGSAWGVGLREAIRRAVLSLDQVGVGHFGAPKLKK